ncbi:helix-turn-helix domain-containing protein [Cryobacterium breve]|uniref:Helix-turn-helix domain-containing protein n=1 Tax=Cryobacterium breve TaxID=1259258 RepID=A0ABY2J4X0_9MICO|nr:helix-turn-helix domain-containing protein [Cryobacterium sp. TmT3-12]TFC98891.1 helix-turn-helix domain-containing protein [Cryobacterium breve]
MGVNRRTGRRWRQATGGWAPLPKPELSGRYLSLEERLRIAGLHLTGVGIRVIAGQVGRSDRQLTETDKALS